MLSCQLSDKAVRRLCAFLYIYVYSTFIIQLNEYGYGYGNGFVHSRRRAVKPPLIYQESNIHKVL